MDRVAAAFDDMARDPHGDTVWITHAGVIRAVELIARGQRHITRADQWPLAAPEYGQWVTLTLQTP
jgi:alpha-ribazole phosphatase